MYISIDYPSMLGRMGMYIITNNFDFQLPASNLLVSVKNVGRLFGVVRVLQWCHRTVTTIEQTVSRG